MILVNWRCDQCRQKYRWHWSPYDCIDGPITMHCPKCGHSQEQDMAMDEKGRFVKGVGEVCAEVRPGAGEAVLMHNVLLTGRGAVPRSVCSRLL